MMITETEIVARFSRLETHVLQRWIAAGWLKPRESGTGFVFDEADVARTHLLFDLSYDLDLRDEEVAMVLSLVDKLNSTRTMLRAMSAAVQCQPSQVREAIISEMRVLLEITD